MSSLGKPRDAKRQSSGQIFLSYPHTHDRFLYYSYRNLQFVIFGGGCPFTPPPHSGSVHEHTQSKADKIIDSDKTSKFILCILNTCYTHIAISLPSMNIFPLKVIVVACSNADIVTSGGGLTSSSISFDNVEIRIYNINQSRD